MHTRRGVVHALLEGAVEVRERLCAAREAHVLAEVVSALLAVAALPALDACLDRDALADVQAGLRGAGPERSDDAGGLVAEDEGCLEGKVAVAAVQVVVHWRGCVSMLVTRAGGETRRGRKSDTRHAGALMSQCRDAGLAVKCIWEEGSAGGKQGKALGKGGRKARAEVVLTVAAAETCGADLDLDVALLWRPDGALLDAEVA